MNFEAKISEFQKAFSRVFPGIETSATKFGNYEDGKEVWGHFHFGVPNENYNLIRSQYFSKTSTFVHFTKADTLTAILKSRAVRLYNLHHLNDPREFSFASSVFQANDEIIDDAKENIFTLSGCDISIIREGKSADEFNMWRLYGDLGKGMAIVFSIENNPRHWIDFHFSKIIYGARKKTRFLNLLESLKVFNTSKPTINVDLGKIMAFHKPLLYKHENELRLLFDRRQKRSGFRGRTYSFMDELKFPIIEISDSDRSRYLQLPIFPSSPSGFDDQDLSIPLLKIKEVIIGYYYKTDEVSREIERIRKDCRNLLGYIPLIRQTRLGPFYWGKK